MDELKSDSDPVLAGMPTIVLVDGNSASASEILVGALQDHKAATLVGETTYGKGSVQRLVPLANGSILKVTVFVGTPQMVKILPKRESPRMLL